MFLNISQTLSPKKNFFDISSDHNNMPRYSEPQSIFESIYQGWPNKNLHIYLYQEQR